MLNDHIAAAHLILKNCEYSGKFITDVDSDTLVLAGGAFARLRVIVRCGTGRYLVTIADLRAKVQEIADSKDYLRDVSIHPEDVFPRDPSNPESMTLSELRAELKRVEDTEDDRGEPDIHHEDYIADLIEDKLAELAA